MKKVAVALVFAVVVLAGCTQPAHATTVLQQSGYKDIQITGYTWMACSKDDTYHTGFTATGPTGARVSGTVCAGLLFKGATIRFD